MNVTRKLRLIVFISVAIVALPSSAFIYFFTKQSILANEKLTLVAETQTLIDNHEAHLNEAIPSLKALAELLAQSFSTSPQVDEDARFDRLVHRGLDGAWRNEGNTDSKTEAGVFLPPDFRFDSEQKRLHLRAKDTINVFGNASKSFFTNVWLLTRAKTEVIYDQTVPDFVHLMAADNNYTQTPWLTLADPVNNPNREPRWTPLLFDPVPKSWMISAIYPIDIDGQWLGSIGHDIYLKTILPSLFKPVQHYAGEQHFLLDNQERFILAGPWQQLLELDPQAFDIHRMNEPDIIELLHKELSDQVFIFPQQITLKNREYIAVAVIVRPVGWRYFRLAPVDEVIAPIQKLFTVLLSVILIMVLLIGVLIELAIGRNIVRRLSILANTVRSYSMGDLSTGVTITGDDEIASAAFDFNHLISKIERQRELEIELLERYQQQRKQEINLLERDRIAIQCARDGIYIIDSNGILVEANPAFYSMLGYIEKEILGHHISSWHKQWTNDQLITKIDELLRNQNSSFEAVYQCNGGELLDVEVITIGIELDEQHYLWCLIRDITERKTAEQHIQQLAHFDPLTGLPNRSLLNQRIESALASVHRNSKQLAVIFLDLDHFKNINDTLGHTAGDDLLMQVGKRMLATVREDDTVSRPGGDEFIVILPNTGVDGAAHVAEKLCMVVSQMYHIEQHDLTVTASIGIAIYPDDGTNFGALSQCADTAMYRAKQEGRNGYRFFTAEMQVHSARILQLENALRQAIELGQLQLHYQPQLSLQDGSVIGAEALLRWYPDFGMVSPAEFIPIAENSGQIIQIGEWVLRTAISQLKCWLDQGVPPFVMAVNISAAQFRQVNLPDLVIHLLEEAQLPTQYLELELTESVAMKNPAAAIAIMNNFHARGICLAIDDFGTGYSSLSYLKSFKIHKLKIDQSFVRNLTETPADQAIVSAVIDLSRNLGFKTIAEGVETIEQLTYLQNKGCDQIQGYYFSKPLPAEQFLAFIQEMPDP
jgi:diguanylate cyclase (GGDEF)-like protein/PAS domain S-box-containing protein